MKPLTEHFMESLQVNEASTAKYEKILDDSKTHKKLAKETGLDMEIIQLACSYVEASLEGMMDDWGNDWIEHMQGWLTNDFSDAFAEYLEEEMDMEDVEDMDFTDLGGALADLFN